MSDACKSRHSVIDVLRSTTEADDGRQVHTTHPIPISTNCTQQTECTKLVLNPWRLKSKATEDV